MSSASDLFIDQLYEMSKGNLRTFDRYEVGKQLGLDREQTDAVVEELAGTRRIQKMVGTVVMLTPAEKKFFDEAKGLK
jgi:hypothetical protein